MPRSTADRDRADLSSLKIDRSGPAPGAAGRRLAVGLVVVALLVAAAVLGWRVLSSMTTAPEVRVTTVRVISGARADSILTATGYLVSHTQAAIGAKVAGRVEEITVEEGDRVDAGQVLAILEHADVDAALQAARAGLARARADVVEAEAVLAEDQRDVARRRSLHEAAVGSREEREKAEARRDASAARLEALRRQVELAEALARESEERRANMFIRAPFSGTVISKDAEVGETITPGGMGAASGRGSVVTLADLAELEVETDVKEDFIGRIRTGQPARIEVDAVPGRTYRGTLRQIVPMGDRSRAVIQVKVRVEDADAALFPEMSASVHFLPGEGQAVPLESEARVYVPAAAVHSGVDGHLVWVVRDERVRAVAVTPGERRDDLVRILDGLGGGETVVLAPPGGLEDGGRVRPVTP